MNDPRPTRWPSWANSRSWCHSPGVIDIDAERARINKQIERKQKELQRIEGKLGNEKFVRNAPPAIVEKERNKAADVQSALTALKVQLDSLA